MVMAREKALELIKSGNKDHPEWGKFEGVDLLRADLREVNLREADLRGADLWGADITGANLTGVNLTRADLTGANLAGTNLTGVNLTRADLTGANLRGANLTGANLDFSCLPLWCGSQGAHIDTNLATQFLLHALAFNCEDPEYQAIKDVAREYCRKNRHWEQVKWQI